MTTMGSLIAKLRSRKAPTISYRLEGDAVATIVDPDGEHIADRIKTLRAGGPSFLCLVASDGSYVQVAGSSRGVTIEYHRVHAAGFSHEVMGGLRSSRRTVTIRTSGGPVVVYGHERLKHVDAVRILTEFLHGRTVPSGYQARDITGDIIAQTVTA